MRIKHIIDTLTRFKIVQSLKQVADVQQHAVKTRSLWKIGPDKEMQTKVQKKKKKWRTCQILHDKY